MAIKLVPLTSQTYSEVVRVNHAELPDEETLKWYEDKSSRNTFLHFLAGIASNGEYVGYGRYVSGTWDPILKPGYAEIALKVATQWAYQGIENEILLELGNLARQDNAQVLQINIGDNQDERLQWFQAQGFDIHGHSYESQLDLKQFNNNIFLPVLKEVEALGIQFASLADFPDDEAFQHRFWDLWWELVTDVPGMEEKPRPENEQMMHLLKDVDKQGFLVAMDGDRWVALSLIIKESDDFYYNSMTGVIRSYQGKGIALAIKLKAIEYAQNNEGKYIRTHNDSKNSPMIALNEKLGYQPKTGIYTLLKEISNIKS